MIDRDSSKSTKTPLVIASVKIFENNTYATWQWHSFFDLLRSLVEVLTEGSDVDVPLAELSSERRAG